MTHEVLHPERKEAMAFYILFLLLLMTVVIVGKEAIAWLLMKLYEIFIQRNPLSI